MILFFPTAYIFISCLDDFHSLFTQSPSTFTNHDLTMKLMEGRHDGDYLYLFTKETEMEWSEKFSHVANNNLGVSIIRKDCVSNSYRHNVLYCGQVYHE